MVACLTHPHPSPSIRSSIRSLYENIQRINDAMVTTILLMKLELTELNLFQYYVNCIHHQDIVIFQMITDLLFVLFLVVFLLVTVLLLQR